MAATGYFTSEVVGSISTDSEGRFRAAPPPSHGAILPASLLALSQSLQGSEMLEATPSAPVTVSRAPVLRSLAYSQKPSTTFVNDLATTCNDLQAPFQPSESIHSDPIDGASPIENQPVLNSIENSQTVPLCTGRAPLALGTTQEQGPGPTLPTILSSNNLKPLQMLHHEGPVLKVGDMYRFKLINALTLYPKFVYVHIYTCIQIHIYIYEYIYTHLHTHVHICHVHKYLFLCVNVFVHLCDLTCKRGSVGLRLRARNC